MFGCLSRLGLLKDSIFKMGLVSLLDCKSAAPTGAAPCSSCFFSHVAATAAT